MDKYLQGRLEAAFSPSDDGQLIRGIRQGVMLADDLIESAPILKSPVGRDLRGHIRRAAVLLRIDSLCQSGDLSFSSEMVQMPRGSWHYVELRSGPFKAHICRTDTPGAFPDDTPIRQDERLANEPGLFSGPIVPFPTLVEKIDELYVWLMFGASRSGKIGHICWGMPSADGGGWLAHSNVLKRFQETQEDVAPEVPARSLVLRFKEDIEEALSKDEKKDQESNDTDD